MAVRDFSGKDQYKVSVPPCFPSVFTHCDSTGECAAEGGKRQCQHGAEM